MNRFLTLALIGVVALACGGGDEEPARPPAPTKANATAAAVAKLILAASPGEAMSVYDARADAPKGEYVVEGRISNIVKGRAVFNLVDLELDYCGGGENKDDACKTPWDYCCTPKDTLAKSMMVVEAHDADGKPLKAGDLDLRLLDLVVARGKLVKDEHGNVTLVATGWYRKERPKLPDGLHWPK